ncbi:hypothetical protein DAEQUDRAFT_672921, partial [Daedalea quercina L-15889]
RGFEVLFLPKFHCKLNPIKQCWGHSKQDYRKCSPSSLETDLERNMLNALAVILLETIRRYFVRAQRFMDAYRRGLSGKQAAWASKKYCGHRMLPNGILDDLEKAGISRDE